MGLKIEDQQCVFRLGVMNVRLIFRTRQQVIEHLRSNRQRTDPQKIEIQQRRNALTRRIKVWRVAQAVYMPQTSVYLSDENGLLTSDDTQRLDHSKPETWPLFLPSDVPKVDRSLCHKGVIETERVLRLAQLQDSLTDLRRFRRALRNLRLYFKRNTAGEGQKTQTKSRTIETGINNQIKRAVRRYRTAYRALSELDPAGAWTNEYRELRDEDNRGPLKEAEEVGTGDGRYVPSWIWASPSAMTLPGEGSIAERQEVSETVRHEWMTCRARADRWEEEEVLLQEEMRRVISYLRWKSRTWSEKVGIRAGSCTTDIQRGADAYACKQANIHSEMAMTFARQWLPYLKTCGFNTEWATELPWISQVLSGGTKLSKRFAVTPADTSPIPVADSPPSIEGLGMGHKYSDACETRRQDNNYKGEGRRDEHPNDDKGSVEGERGFDDGEQDSDDENEDYSDEDYGEEDEGFNDGAETDGGFGFEYDDEYMT